MNKPKFETPDMTMENIDKIANLFPNCITETKDADGKLKKAVNFGVLKQMLSKDIADGDEAYEFTWVGKKAAIVEANTPIRKTLRPVIEDEVTPTGKDSEGNPYCSTGSVNWDTTQNLYIEGDNLEVLKLLQESYLNKIKMIYIDPPYNTGNDFIYRDDFTADSEEYQEDAGLFDEEGNRMFKNTDTNGRFHSDWCSMIYTRLLLARNLLSDDGVIFISIDDNEVDNLRKISDEVFGERNCLGPLIQNKQNAKNDTTDIQKNHEFILVYRKNTILHGCTIKGTLSRELETYRDVFEESGRYYYLNDSITTRGEGGTLRARPNLGYTVYFNPITKDKIAVADYDIEKAKTVLQENEVYKDDENLLKNGYVIIRPPKVRGNLGCWTWSLDKFNNQKDEIVITGKPDNYAIHKRTFVDKKLVKNIEGKLQFISRSFDPVKKTV